MHEHGLTREEKGKRLWSFLSFAMLLGLTVLVVLPIAARLDRDPGRDSGFFLYIGQRILEGAIPYRDVWDHKPPGIFYLNAFGLWIGSTNGVWLVQLVFALLATTLSFHTLMRAFGLMPALVGTFLWLLHLPFVIETGNLTEQYALPLQFLALYLLQRSTRTPNSVWPAFSLGLVVAGTFLLRQNLIGLSVAAAVSIWLYDARRGNWRAGVRYLLWVALGALIPLIAVAGYFAFNDALDELWDGAFVYNAALSARSTLGNRFSVFRAGLMIFDGTGFLVVALLGWVLATWQMVVNRAKRVRPEVLCVVIGLPIEFLLTSVSGRFWLHYFMVWLPLFGLSSGFAVYQTLIRRDRIGEKGVLRAALASLVAVVIGLSVWKSPILDDLNGASLAGDARTAVDYIQANTAPDDRVLMWGADVGTNFMSGRNSATTYPYLYPLLLPGYASDARIETFLNELESDPPVLIVDTSESNFYIPPLDAAAREGWMPPEAPPYYQLPSHLDEGLKEIMGHYEPMARIGDGSWVAYRYRGP